MADEKKDLQLPSWAGKKYEDMTDDEKKDYEEHLRKKFTWEPGDLKKVGHEPLTEDEKALVESIKKQEEEDEKE